jgi:hypothetical protein
MFWILNSENFASNPSFCTMRAYLREANRESSSDFAPVTTILPEANIRAVVLGSRIRMITAAKRWRMTNEEVRTFTQTKGIVCTNLWVILCVPGMQSDRLEVKPTIKVDSRNDILQGGNNALNSSDVLPLKR